MAGAFLLAAPLAAQSDRYSEYTKAAASGPKAQVLTASVFGADGAEWFSGAAFLPDGRILLAGSSLGPRLTPDGRETVLGPDGEPPSASATPPDPSYANEFFTWNHGQATGFALLLDSSASRITAIWRLPWKSGGFTDACAGSGDLCYLTGKGRRSALSATLIPLENLLPEDLSDEGFFLLALDVRQGPRWIRFVPATGGTPTLQAGPDDTLLWRTENATFQLNSEGIRLNTFSPPPGLRGPIKNVKTHWVADPLHNRLIRYGEHNHHTGREPWRCPVLNLYHPDQTLQLELYNWLGPIVGHDAYRLQSDSAIRGLACLPDGDIILHAWSDGGNSAMLREPFDLSRPATRFRGLGWQMWGAGVLSLAYVIRLDSNTWEVKAGTQLASFLPQQNKPNSLRIDDMAVLPDGTVALATHSATAMIQTPNALSTMGRGSAPPPSGPGLIVLNPTLDRLLFASALPATGTASVRHRDGAIVTASHGPVRRIAYLSSALAQTVPKNPEIPALPVPLQRPFQSSHGGGLIDAYCVILQIP